jgi:hypothetical protein
MGGRRLKLSKADLERLAAATGRFVKLPNSGWVELDTRAVQGAHETMADMGVDGLIAVPQKVGLEHVAHLGEDEFTRFVDSRPKPRPCANASAISRASPAADLPKALQAELRPYQKDGFDFLAHLGARPAGRHSGRRHGPRQNPANPDLAGLAAGAEQEESQAVAGHLPRLRPA